MLSKEQKKERDELAGKILDMVHNQGLTKAETARQLGIKIRRLHHIVSDYFPNGFEETLKENGFEPHTWDHGWLKTNESSIHIKNPNAVFDQESLLKRIEETIKSIKPVTKKVDYPTIKDSYCMVISLADVHMGKLSVVGETGTQYNMNIAEERVKGGIQGLLTKTSGFPIDKIILILGNDMLHSDTPSRKTTSGTQMDTDGAWTESFDRALRLYIYAVETLRPYAKVHVIHNPSNHDYMSGYMLAQSLLMYYSNTDVEYDLTFDLNQRHRKYFKYGKNLIACSHGDGAKEVDLGNILLEEAKEHIADTEYRYWYLHHVHHRIVKEKIGYEVRYLKSVSSMDRWHSDNAYISKQALEAFIHCKEYGQVASFNHPF